MDNGGWMPAQDEGNLVLSDANDWRTELSADSRQRIVNMIMETLKRHLPAGGCDGLSELRKIAARFEEKIFTSAENQADYLRKISLKMLTMETKSAIENSMASNPTGENQNMQDQVEDLGTTEGLHSVGDLTVFENLNSIVVVLDKTEKFNEVLAQGSAFPESVVAYENE